MVVALGAADRLAEQLGENAAEAVDKLRRPIGRRTRIDLDLVVEGSGRIQIAEDGLIPTSRAGP
jgi:hypothetical protein